MSDRDPTKAAPLPGSIRAVIDGPGGRRLLTAGFPGLRPGQGGAPMIDPIACTETLEGLRAFGAARLVVLVQPRELDPAAFPMLRRAAESVGLDLAHRSIPDYSVPDAEFMAWWEAGEAEREAIWSAGHALAFCCRYGAGRSGTLASLCLIGMGLGADAAISRVRRGFPESVETLGQEDWLRLQARSRMR